MSARHFTHADFGKEVRIEQFGHEVRLTFVAPNCQKADSLVNDIMLAAMAGGFTLSVMGKPSSVEAI